MTTFKALAHVLLECAQNRKRRVAVLAVIHVHAGPIVCLQVARQFARLGARVAAQLASIRLLSGVRPSMHSQIAAVLEHLAAVFAGVVSQTRHRGAATARVAVTKRLLEQLRRQRPAMEFEQRTVVFHVQQGTLEVGGGSIN